MWNGKEDVVRKSDKDVFKGEWMKRMMMIG